jgi:hypothetical protein
MLIVIYYLFNILDRRARRWGRGWTHNRVPVACSKPPPRDSLSSSIEAPKYYRTIAVGVPKKYCDIKKYNREVETET